MALPAAAKMLREAGRGRKTWAKGSGKGGRITKGDVLAYLDRIASQPAKPAAAPAAKAPRPLEEAGACA